MKDEISAAVMFLIRFIEKSETFPRDQIENFKQHLIMLLTQRFEKHWFPEVPTRGQGYRCIRVNGTSPVDLTLEQAALLCGLRYKDLSLPTELTVWVDPSEVCYRLGESEGSLCTLATFPSDLSRKMSSTVPHYHYHPHHHHHQRHHQKVPYEALPSSNGKSLSYVTAMPPPSTAHFRTKAAVPSHLQTTRARCDKSNFLPPQAPLYTQHARHYARNYKNILTA